MNLSASSAEQSVFRALSDPTRREILLMLAVKDRSIAEVADGFDMTRAAIRKHIVVLEEGDLVKVIPRGRERINRLNPEALSHATRWLAFFDAFWDERLSALKNAVEGGAAESTTKFESTIKSDSSTTSDHTTTANNTTKEPT